MEGTASSMSLGECPQEINLQPIFGIGTSFTYNPNRFLKLDTKLYQDGTSDGARPPDASCTMQKHHLPSGQLVGRKINKGSEGDKVIGDSVIMNGKVQLLPSNGPHLDRIPIPW